MKKRILALALVALVLGATPVYAADSATKDDVVMGEVADLAKVTATSEAGTVKVEALKADDSATKAVTDAVVKVLNSDSVENYAEVEALADITLDKEIPAGGAKITIKVDGITSTDTKDNVVVLHWDANKGWEKVTVDSVAKGEVTAVFTSLSPVAVVRVIPGSPQTGLNLLVLPIVAAAGLAGAVVCGKKMNK